MQAVGEFDEHDADVVDHGEHHLAQVLGLALFAGGEINLADLGDAFDEMRDLLAEFLAHIDDGHRGVFDAIVQQAGGDGVGVHLHVREDHGDFQRMDYVRLAGSARLAGVILQGEVVGAANDLQIVVGTVGTDRLGEVTEARDPQHVGRDLLAKRRHV